MRDVLREKRFSYLKISTDGKAILCDNFHNEYTREPVGQHLILEWRLFPSQKRKGVVDICILYRIYIMLTKGRHTYFLKCFGALVSSIPEYRKRIDMFSGG
jgi:hypothetical protein